MSLSLNIDLDLKAKSESDEIRSRDDASKPSSEQRARIHDYLEHQQEFDRRMRHTVRLRQQQASFPPAGKRSDLSTIYAVPHTTTGSETGVCSSDDLDYPRCLSDPALVCSSEDPDYPKCGPYPPQQHGECSCTEDNIFANIFDKVFPCPFEAFSNILKDEQVECFDKIASCAHCYKDFGGSLNTLIKKHISKTEVRLDVIEDVELDIQLQVVISNTGSFWLTVDFYPPDIFVPSISVSNNFAGGPSVILAHPGWVKNGDAAGKKSGEYGDSGKTYPYYNKPQNGVGKSGPFGFGVQKIDFPPLSLQLGAAFTAVANVTLPGLDLTLQKGDFILLDLLAEDKLQHNLHAKVKYRDAKVVIQDPSIDLSFQLGPRVTINLISFASKNKLVNMLGQPLNIGARADLIRFDTILKEVSDVDEQCTAGGNIKSAWSLDVIHRIGMSAWFQIFAVRIDTSNLGYLDKGDAAVPGLYLSTRLYRHCTDTRVVKGFAKKLWDAANEAMGDWADKISESLSSPERHGEPINNGGTLDRDRMIQQEEIREYYSRIDRTELSVDGDGR
ncbi:hypothetical protein LTR10_001921 [Elasticomyces elasticus]|nr:hypothetical protein LTR10_001921 [Elasticomyces elasticus]KAK4969136.1 hypothetical protein LTR42_009415 [Elasticomyces elasticus]